VFISVSIWFILVFFHVHLVHFKKTKVATLRRRSRESNHMRVAIAGDKLRLKPSLRFVTARFANLGDLDETSQLGSSRWHSTFFKP